MSAPGDADPRGVALIAILLLSWHEDDTWDENNTDTEWAEKYVAFAKDRPHLGDCPHAAEQGPITCDRCVWEEYAAKARCILNVVSSGDRTALVAAESRLAASEADRAALERRVAEARAEGLEEAATIADEAAAYAIRSAETIKDVGARYWQTRQWEAEHVAMGIRAAIRALTPGASS